MSGSSAIWMSALLTASADSEYALTPAQLAAQRVLQACTLVVVCCVGAAIGSFLNVVVYRWPRGMSLRHPRSRCPRCETPIARRDKLPIVSWLLLRGRCRACQAPISIRYLLVELAVAAQCLALLFGELLRGGANLPVRIPNGTYGNPILWIIWYTKWDIIGISLFHAGLLLALLALALMGRDGFPPPRGLVGGALGLGVLWPVVWPKVHPVPLVMPVPSWLVDCRWEVTWTDLWFSPGWPLHFGLGLEGAANALCGGFVGGLVGRAATWRRSTLPWSASLRWAWVLVGVVLGWQACLSTALAWGLCLAGLRLAFSARGRVFRADGAALALWLVAGVQVLAWKRLDEWPVWIGHEGIRALRWSGLGNWAVAGLAVLGVVWASLPPASSRQQAA